MSVLIAIEQRSNESRKPVRILSPIEMGRLGGGYQVRVNEDLIRNPIRGEM